MAFYLHKYAHLCMKASFPLYFGNRINDFFPQYFMRYVRVICCVYIRAFFNYSSGIVIARPIRHISERLVSTMENRLFEPFSPSKVICGERNTLSTNGKRAGAGIFFLLILAHVCLQLFTYALLPIGNHAG